MALVRANLQVTTPIVQAGNAFQCVLTLTNDASTAAQISAIRQTYQNGSGGLFGTNGASTRSGVTFPLGPGPGNLLTTGPIPGTPGIGGAGDIIPANGTATWTFYANMFAPASGPISVLFWTNVVVTFSDGTSVASNLAQVTMLQPTFLRSQVVAQANFNATSSFPTSGVTYATSAAALNQLGYDMTTAGASFFPV
jgi:hypothetical protein